MKKPLANTHPARAGAGSAQGRAGACLSTGALKAKKTAILSHQNADSGHVGQAITPLKLAYLSAAAAILIVGSVHAQPDSAAQSRTSLPVTQVGEAHACATEPRAAYLACFEQNSCSSRSLSEPARRACDACWETYQEQVSACKPLMSGNKKNEQAYPAKSRDQVP